MIRKHKRDWRLGVGLAAAVAFSGATFTPAVALESWVFDNSGCDMRAKYASDSRILEGEAKNLARHYLRQLGFTSPGTSQQTARVSGVEAAGEKWRISFKYGGYMRNKTAVFFIDRIDGLIGSTALAADAPRGLVVG